MDSVQEYVIHTSSKTVSETVADLKKAIESHGITVFSVIDHGKEARKVNLNLPDEQLIIFGDPKVGTFLMQENPLIGVELPLKLLVWSAEGKTQIAFPNVALWQKRFSLVKQVPILEKMLQLLNKLASTN